jgi:excisionase family DNA binding protein
MERLLTPKEAADLLRVTVGTLSVWRCTSRYPLKFVKVGRVVRYREADIIAFLEKRAQ